MSDPSVTFFVVRSATGQSLSRPTVPSMAHVDNYPLNPGEEIVLFDKALGSPALFHTELSGGDIVVVPLAPDPAAELIKAIHAALRDIKELAEIHKSADLSPGIEKAREYDEKAAEGRAAAEASPEILTDEEFAALYPQAWTEHQLTGQDRTEILASYLANSLHHAAIRRNVSAIERDACLQVEAADTPAAVAAIVAAIDWTWCPA